MGIFATVGRILSPSKKQARVDLRPQPSRGPDEPPLAPERPVAIDLHTEEDPDTELEGFDPSPERRLSEPGGVGSDAAVEVKKARSRQELIAELQKNYQEVLGIVRKVDSHLDEQGQRSRRMAEIAERFPAAADDLSQLRVRQAAVHEALEAVSLALHERDGVLGENQQAMLGRLDEIRGLMAESSEAERQLIGSLVEFRDTMAGMTAATERLGDAVERIEAREDERIGELLGAIRSIKSSVVAVGIVAAGAAVIALGLGFIALVL